MIFVMVSRGDPLESDASSSKAVNEDQQDGRSVADSSENPSKEDIFRILSNRRRRYAVYLFSDYDTGIELRELSRQIAAWENDKSVTNVTSEERRRVYTALQQFHMPKMDEAGVIDYNSRRSTIQSTDNVAVLRPYLEHIPGTTIPWCLYYLVFGVIGTLLAGAIVTGVTHGLLNGGGLALVISILLTGSAAVHAYYERQK